MEQHLDLAMQYVRMTWRYRWIALVVAGIVCVAGWIAVVLMPDRYAVEAKVFLDTRSLLRPVLKGLAVDSSSQLDTAMLMRRTLLVRPNLETVARKTDMDLRAETPEAFDRILTGLTKAITVSGTSRDNIFVIAYENQDPELATKVVNSLLQIFVEKSLGDSRKDTSKTKQFIDRQIAEYEARLVAAEDRLKEFKRRNIDVMPDSDQGYYSRLTALTQQLTNARLELAEATQRRDQVHKQLESVNAMLATPTTGANASLALDPRSQRIETLRKQLDQMLLNYTDQHPDVIATRRVLDELESDRAAEDAAAPPSEAVTARRVENPIYQELTVAMSEVEGEVAAMAARVQEYERREDELKQLIDTIPQVEAELAKLNRDYTINKKQYEELVRRREALKLADEAGQTTDDVRFNVIEPPRVPLVPVGPDRPLYSAGALIAGLGAGVGLTLLIALMRPTVYSKEAFEEFTDLPVLGTVSRLWTARERLRRRVEVVTFATACVGLLGLFAGLLAVFHLNIDLAGRIVGLGERFL